MRRRLSIVLLPATVAVVICMLGGVDGLTCYCTTNKGAAPCIGNRCDLNERKSMRNGLSTAACAAVNHSVVGTQYACVRSPVAGPQSCKEGRKRSGSSYTACWCRTGDYCNLHLLKELLLNGGGDDANSQNVPSYRLSTRPPHYRPRPQTTTTARPTTTSTRTRSPYWRRTLTTYESSWRYQTPRVNPTTRRPQLDQSEQEEGSEISWHTHRYGEPSRRRPTPVTPSPRLVFRPALTTHRFSPIPPVIFATTRRVWGTSVVTPPPTVRPRVVLFNRRETTRTTTTRRTTTTPPTTATKATTTTTTTTRRPTTTTTTTTTTKRPTTTTTERPTTTTTTTTTTTSTTTTTTPTPTTTTTTTTTTTPLTTTTTTTTPIRGKPALTREEYERTARPSKRRRPSTTLRPTSTESQSWPRTDDDDKRYLNSAATSPAVTQSSVLAVTLAFVSVIVKRRS